jgi:TrmH family RNA methyltransferase
LAIITPAADIYDPKVVRASMGALFKMNFQLFPSFDDYVHSFPLRELYPFMTDGINDINTINTGTHTIKTLIFGSESSGLPASFAETGTSVKIPQTGMVDSLNLSVAVGIGLYEFSKQVKT